MIRRPLSTSRDVRLGPDIKIDIAECSALDWSSKAATSKGRNGQMRIWLKSIGISHSAARCCLGSRYI